MKPEPMWRRYMRLFGANPRGDTEDELTFHYEMRVRDYVRRGLSEESARVAARERLGDLTGVREVCGVEGERQERRRQKLEWLNGVRQDIKYGVRVLLRSPVFALVAVVTLALGIGATTSIFSVVQRVLLSPLPYAQPEQLVMIWESSPQGEVRNVVSSGNYLEWRERSRSFAGIGALQGTSGAALTGDGEPVQIQASVLTPSVLELLRVAPQLGRTFNRGDAENGGVVLLSHALWQQRFGGERNVVGRVLTLDGVSYSVVGVMPRDFSYPDAAVKVWLPLRDRTLDPTERRSHNYYVVARLKPGVTVAQAQAEMTALASALAREHPQHMTGWGVNVVALHADLTRPVRPLLLVLLGCVAVVLLIACGNLANLMLARAVAREGEFALRGALGAGRARIVRQLLTESLVIGVSGGTLGVLLAASTLRVLLSAAPSSIPFLQQVQINWQVLGFAAAATLASTLLFGLVPALRVAQGDLQSTIREGRSSGVRHARLRSTLLVAEVALSAVLLMGAGLLVRSFQELQRADLGFRSRDLVVMDLQLPYARYSSTAQHIEFYERLLTRLRQIPRVLSVSGSTSPPGSQDNMTFSFGIQGRQAANPSGREDPEILVAVTPEYFRTMGIPLLQGRAFEAQDRAGAPPVVIISQSLAQKHWPDQNPVGQRIAFRPGETPWVEIVGVVGDTRMSSPDVEPAPMLFVPHAQKTWPWLSWLSITARVSPGSSVAELRQQMQAALWELDAQLPIREFSTAQQRYGATMARRSFAMILVLTFALAALLLSVVGLYGLMAYTVAQQRREFSIRLALGARNGDIMRNVLGRSMGLSALGLSLGLLASLGSTRLLDTLLYNVSGNDPLTLLAIAGVVLLTAGLASWVPALRAVRSDPLRALKGA